MADSNGGFAPTALELHVASGPATITLRVDVDCEELWRAQGSELGRRIVDDIEVEISQAVRDRLVPAVAELALQADRRIAALLLEAVTDVLRESVVSERLNE